MRSLYNEEDVERTIDEGDNRSGVRRISLDKGDNAIWILSPKQANGFKHWVNTGEGRRPVVCAGGPEGEGWAPDECMLCDFIKSQFAAAREASNAREAEGIKTFAKGLKANASISMIAAKGEIRIMRRRNKKTKKFRDIAVPVFDTEALTVGVLQMSNAQYKNFIGLVKDDEYPFIKKLRNLTDRPIIFDKRKRGDDRMETVRCRPGTKVAMDLPDEIEWDEEDFDLEADYEIDVDRIEEVVAELTGDTDDDDTEDEDETFYDDDGEDEDDDDDDFEDDDV